VADAGGEAIVGLPVQRSAGALFLNSAPLFKKEGYTGIVALVAN
jgi:hypothetical protein